MQNLKIICSECSSLNTLDIRKESQSFICIQCKSDLDDPSPIEVTDESCVRHIKEDSLPLLIDFYSNHCVPCMEMYDDYEAAAFGYSMRVRFLKVNTDTFREVAMEYQVRSLPTIVAFKNGKEVSRVSGVLTQFELSKWGKELIKI
jgi:thioredoxin 2